MNTYPRCLLVATALLAGGAAQAADIITDLREGRRASNGGYFELGIGAAYIDTPFVEQNSDYENGSAVAFSMNGAWRYKRFFFEATYGGYDGLNLGFNLVDTPQWSVDFLAASAEGLIIEKDREPADRDDALFERENFYSGAGVRVTRYAGDYVMQAKLVTDTHHNNGVSASARLGRGWQVRNWNLHALGTLDYSSDKTTDYFFGVDADEATAKYAVYEAEAGDEVWSFCSKAKCNTTSPGVPDDNRVLNL